MSEVGPVSFNININYSRAAHERKNVEQQNLLIDRVVYIGVAQRPLRRRCLE